MSTGIKASSQTGPVPATSNASTASAPTSFKGFKVPEILTWRNPQKTGLLLAETLGLFAVLGSTITLRYFLKLTSTVVGLLSIAELLSRSVSGQRTGLVSSYQPSRFLPLRENAVNNVANYASNLFRRTTAGVQQLLDARDPTKGLKLAGFLYLTYILLGLLPLRTLILTGIILAFSLPPVYLQFKPEVDRAVNEIHGHVHSHLKKVYDHAYAKAGPQIDYVKKLVGPRGGFDKANNVSPIGEVPTAAAKPTKFTSTSSSSTTGSSGEAGATPIVGTVKVPVSQGSHATTTANPSSSVGATSQVPEDVFKSFDTVPTLAGNIPIDQEKLQAALAADKAKYDGAVKGL